MNKLKLFRKKSKHREKNNNKYRIEMFKQIINEEDKGKGKEKEVAIKTKRNKHKTKSDMQAVTVDHNHHHLGHHLHKVDS